MYLVVGIACILLLCPLCLWSAWELRGYWGCPMALLLAATCVLFGIGCLTA